MFRAPYGRDDRDSKGPLRTPACPQKPDDSEAPFIGSWLGNDEGLNVHDLFPVRNMFFLDIGDIVVDKPKQVAYR
jgi:hypothetical protein